MCNVMCHVVVLVVFVLLLLLVVVVVVVAVVTLSYCSLSTLLTDYSPTHSTIPHLFLNSKAALLKC
jgi:hypothetical protein